MPTCSLFSIYADLHAVVWLVGQENLPRQVKCNSSLREIVATSAYCVSPLKSWCSYGLLGTDISVCRISYILYVDSYWVAWLLYVVIRCQR